jgi:hypothetical protein
LNSKYGKTSKTKYDITTHDDYTVATNIVYKASSFDTSYDNVPKYNIVELADIFELGHEVQRYERTKKIYWLTMNDRCVISDWRMASTYNIDPGFLSTLHTCLLFEFA